MLVDLTLKSLTPPTFARTVKKFCEESRLIGVVVELNSFDFTLKTPYGITENKVLKKSPIIFKKTLKIVCIDSPNLLVVWIVVVSEELDVDAVRLSVYLK